jgi:hypothetical protein
MYIASKFDPVYAGKLIPRTQITRPPLLTFESVELLDGAYFRIQ